MNKTFIFQKNTRFIAGIFGLAMLQFASSCKTTDDPTATKKDTIVTDQVYKDVESISMIGYLSSPRSFFNATTVGNKTYFVSGYNSTIDIFESGSQKWTTEPLPTDIPLDSLKVAGSKIFYTYSGLFPVENPSAQLKVYDLVTKKKDTYKLSKPNAVKLVSTWAEKAVVVTDVNDINVFDLNSKATNTIALPSSKGIIDLSIWKNKAYFLTFSSSDIYVYDLEMKNWSTITLNGSYHFDRMNITDDKLILSGNNMSTFHVVDIAEKTQITYQLTANRTNTGVIVAGNKVFFAGGYDISPDGFGYQTNGIDVFDTRTKIISKENMNEKRVFFASAVNGNLVLIAGGYEHGKVPFKSVEFFILNK